MKEIYRRGSKKYISWHKSYVRRMRLVVGAILIFILGAAVIAWDLYFRNNSIEPVTSNTTITSVSFDTQVFDIPYFKFSDSGNWNFAKTESSSSKFIWRKYLGKSQIVQHQLIVYVNQIPIPLELASPLALPVVIKDGGLKASNVSRPCGELYGKNELHKVRPQIVEGTTILCDPDLRMNKILFGQVGGDYNLRLRRTNGSTASYIIIYQDQRISPDNETIMQIVESFQAI